MINAISLPSRFLPRFALLDWELFRFDSLCPYRSSLPTIGMSRRHLNKPFFSWTSNPITLSVLANLGAVLFCTLCTVQRVALEEGQGVFFSAFVLPFPIPSLATAVHRTHSGSPSPTLIRLGQ